MRLLADEHVPPAIVAALRSDGHDVERVGESIELGSDDRTVLDHASTTDRVILSEDVDFRGGNPSLSAETYPGVLVCETGAKASRIAVAVGRIEELAVPLAGSVYYVPGNWC